MERNEFYRWFTEQVQGRWPKWQIKTVLLNDWFETFGKYDAKLLNRAISQHRIADCPSQPNTHRLLELIRSLQPATPKAAFVPPQDCLPIKYIQKNLDKLYDMEQRIEIMVGTAKFCSEPRQRDPQAYDLAVQRGLIAAPAAKPNSQKLAFAVAEFMTESKSNENNFTGVPGNEQGKTVK